jgi:hypothetical protein
VEGDVVFLGSPITADPANQRDVLVQVVDRSGTVIGSLDLPPRQTVDMHEGPGGELVLTNLGTTPLVYFLNGISLTLPPGRTVTRVPAPRAVKQKVLADLIGLAESSADRQDRERLQSAAEHVRRSLEAALWIDEAHLQPHRGARAFSDDMAAANELRALTDSRKTAVPAATLEAFMNALAAVDRELALVAIGDALRADADPRDIELANTMLAAGDTDVAHGRLDSAIAHYRLAWQRALKAVG